MRNKGITLIALVLTIIVLIILAGVSISSISGKNGILSNASMARKMSETSNEKEAIQLMVTLANMEKNLNTSNKYYIGEPLYDQTLENGDKWNILINNETLKKYGNGWNHILKGTEIPNYGKTKYEWIINYNNGETIEIDSNYTNLSYKSSLAVTDSLALNIDATNLADENWGDVIKHGDVKYSKENKSLYFDGDGDYLELEKNADFSNGFIFEIYANLERILYKNERNLVGNGIFCKIVDFKENIVDSMRFGFSDGGLICKLNGVSSWQGEGKKLKTSSAICTINENDCGYEANKDFYLTFVYTRYNEENPQWTEKADKVEYYIDGNLYGYTYYGINSYNDGCSVWNTPNAHFYLGVCPWHENGCLYYLKGNVYCTRLYERALTQEEVTNNVTKAQLYRQMK